MNMDFEHTASIVRAHIEEAREEIPPDLLTKIERFLEADSEDEFWKAGDALTRVPQENERLRTLLALIVHTMILRYLSVKRQ